MTPGGVCIQVVNSAAGRACSGQPPGLCPVHRPGCAGACRQPCSMTSAGPCRQSRSLRSPLEADDACCAAAAPAGGACAGAGGGAAGGARPWRASWARTGTSRWPRWTRQTAWQRWARLWRRRRRLPCQQGCPLPPSQPLQAPLFHSAHSAGSTRLAAHRLRGVKPRNLHCRLQG